MKEIAYLALIRYEDQSVEKVSFNAFGNIKISGADFQADFQNETYGLMQIQLRGEVLKLVQNGEELVLLQNKGPVIYKKLAIEGRWLDSQVSDNNLQVVYELYSGPHTLTHTVLKLSWR